MVSKITIGAGFLVVYLNLVIVLLSLYSETELRDHTITRGAEMDKKKGPTKFGDLVVWAVIGHVVSGFILLSVIYYNYYCIDDHIRYRRRGRMNAYPYEFEGYGSPTRKDLTNACLSASWTMFLSGVGGALFVVVEELKVCVNGWVPLDRCFAIYSPLHLIALVQGSICLVGISVLVVTATMCCVNGCIHRCRSRDPEPARVPAPGVVADQGAIPGPGVIADQGAVPGPGVGPETGLEAGPETGPGAVSWHDDEGNMVRIEIPAMMDRSTCTICLADLLMDKTIATPCGHVFHEGCLVTWGMRKRVCPNCMTPF